jgi:hypothetical protein
MDTSTFPQSKPALFTDEWIDMVPNTCTPYRFCVKYKKTKGRFLSGGRRKSVSMEELIGGKGVK